MHSNINCDSQNILAKQPGLINTEIQKLIFQTFFVGFYSMIFYHSTKPLFQLVSVSFSSLVSYYILTMEVCY